MDQEVLPTQLARTHTGCLCGEKIANIYDITTRSVTEQELPFGAVYHAVLPLPLCR